ncbi:MAG: hypothetical protein ACD_69C00032G0004 [uncultured bacterium]|nr:MAG: hypothetical protein ACD_69C00032G0004 [uncultured bacterium]OGT09587.1 MAG: hypothetical protein A2V89_03750 [Gammaproteobacteria bacterium RBG_16_37_9]HBC71368.1 EamA/RhaT family transporter [Coxiellaceae bacterium]HBS51391.1 EamA/RhaT family transporter [Coxiellaceae bacterium]HBY55938.1 EamA/RhaT family transporter [Coxiellaceae bacterium]
MNIISLFKQQRGVLYAVSSGLCYGLLGYFGISLMNSGLSISNMLFWRFTIATLFMCVILIPKYKTIFNSYKKNLLFIVYGIVFYTSSAMFYFMSSKHIGSGLAMVIFFTYPAIVMMFNVLFHKMVLRNTYYISFFIIIIGMICLANANKLTFNILGISLGILAAFLYACYILASKRTHIAPSISTLMVSLGSMISCLIASYVYDAFNIPNGFNEWFNIVGMGTLCTAIPILFFLQALKYISSEQASMLSVFEPVAVLIFGVILLGEKISIIQIVGAIIILSGAIITLLPSKIKNINNIQALK